MAGTGWRASFLDHLADETRERDLDAFDLDAPTGQGRGEVLEHLIGFALERARLDGCRGIWSNVLVPTRGPGVDTAEIDVLMLTERAICVFEAKNYGGWIFGDEGERAWTQARGSAGRRRFYNPIMQNAAHVDALESSLVVGEGAVVSYIVFSDRAHVERVPRRGRDWRLCRLGELTDLVRHDLATRPPAFFGLQLTTLQGRIDRLARSSTPSARATHARSVREAHAATTCPRCGAMLVERVGPYGRFWGCDGYPDCTYTRPIG